MSKEYDISRAFRRIENDLMDSMMRNLNRHQAEEDELGIKWEQWQVLQLKELERYRKENKKKFTGDFTEINDRIDDLFRQTSEDAQAQEEAKILNDIQKGRYYKEKKDVSFFNVNDQKLNILIERTKADFIRAEYAVLRKAEDEYRKIIFDAQVYANITNDYRKATEIGAKDLLKAGIGADQLKEKGITYEQAIDMSTKDLLRNGIRPIEYRSKKTGEVVSRHSLSEYAEMCVRTGNKRAYLMGEGNAHDAFGIHTVRVNKRTQACPKCVGFLGRVLVDDVYAGGTPKEAQQMGVPLLSQAIQAGFLHPNCKDIYSMYIEGVSRPPEPWTQEEIEQIVGDYNAEQELEHAKDMQESYERMAKYSLDPSNQAKYQARADGWQARVADIKAGMPTAPIVPPTPQPAEPPQPTPQETVPTSPRNVFVPASTIKEAEQYAQRFTDTSRFGAVGVSYDGVSVDVANAVNKTIGEFFDTYDVEPFGGIIAPKGNTKLGKLMSDATAGYAPMRHSFLLNRKSLKDLKTAEKALLAERKVITDILAHPERYDFSKMSSMAQRVVANSAVSGRSTIPLTVEEVLWHELGHALEKKIAKTPYFDAIKANMAQYAPKVSGYATETLSEYIAESFCSYKKGENIIDPELVKAFDAVRRK